MPRKLAIPWQSVSDPNQARGPSVEQFCAIAAAVLELDAGSVGAADHFFGLGGTSLSALIFIAEVYDRFGAELDLGDLFAAESMGDLAALCVLPVGVG
jgi:acyl carrier protein